MAEQNLPNGCIRDISVEQIRHSGIHSLLQSKIPLLYFLIFTLSEKCAENLVRMSYLFSLVLLSRS